ncbi:MAG: terminase large subunit, partial [Clostridia bacterium]|nr:terminase large subunit [Clostridia bacterium]
FEIASEKEFDQFDRSAPRGYVPEPLFKQTTLTFNPWSEGHWLKKRFFDDPGRNVWTGTTNYLCNEFLDVADIDGYEEMKRKNPRLYAVAGLGEWGVADGLIYDNWEVAPFDIREVEEQAGAWKFRHVFGLDYGYTNDPTAFIAAAVNKTDGVMYIYDEHYEKRMLNSDIARMIKEKGYAKERIRADSAEPKSNEELRRLGIGRVMPAEKGRDSIVNGISRIQEYRLVVHPRCRNTVAELSSYHWITDKTGSGKNKPADSDNHLMDALRYAVLDLKHFRPKKETEQKYPRGTPPYFSAGLTPEDLKGGWT